MAHTEATAKERRRERTVAEILRIAGELVLERGPDALSLREVARRADYSPAALYRYFPSRKDILAALGNEGLRVLGGYLDAVPAGLPAAERLVALARAYVRFAAENPERFTLLFNRMNVELPTWETYTRIAWPFTVLVEAVRTGVDGGELEGVDPAAAAFGLWSLAHGAATLRSAHLRDVAGDYDGMLDSAFRAYVNGLTCDGSAR